MRGLPQYGNLDYYHHRYPQCAVWRYPMNPRRQGTLGPARAARTARTARGWSAKRTRERSRQTLGDRQLVQLVGPKFEDLHVSGLVWGAETFTLVLQPNVYRVFLCRIPNLQHKTAACSGWSAIELWKQKHMQSQVFRNMSKTKQPKHNYIQYNKNKDTKNMSKQIEHQWT